MLLPVISAFVFLGLALAGCNDHPVSRTGANYQPDPTISYPHPDLQNVDILFVIGNGPSMCEEQKHLRENFDALLMPLVESGVDFQIGVVASQEVGIGE